VVQSHYVDDLPTVLIAPLLRPSERPVYRGVSIAIALAQGSFLLSLAELATVNRALLRRHVGDVREHEDAIHRALDRVFTGF
jgi:toxin CcdB